MSKSSNDNSARSGGIGFCGVLTIVFIVLKLTNVISWSWIWVLSPLWISVAIFILVMIIMLAVITIAYIIKEIFLK